MLSEEELQKKWESLTFTDNFIFSHVMHDENWAQDRTASQEPLLSKCC